MTSQYSEPSMRQQLKTLFKIDRRLVPVKLTFIFQDGYVGCITPFLILFFTSLGLTEKQAGFINGLGMAISSVSGPFWGGLADATGHRKFIFIILCIGAACTVFPLPYVAGVLGKYDNATCHTNLTTENASIHCVPSRHLQNSDYLYEVMLVLTTIARIFFHGLASLLDGIEINVIKTMDASYGSQKIFSVIGYAMFNFVSGLVIHHWNPAGLSRYTGAFYVFLFCVLALLPTGYILISKGKWNDREPDIQSKPNKYQIFMQLLKVCGKGDTIVYLLTVFVSGCAADILTSFGFKIFHDYCHASPLEMTITVLISAVSDIIFFILSSKISKAVGGPYRCIIIGIFCYFLRYFILSFTSSTWLVMLLQVFDGSGVALTWTAIIEIAYVTFPENTQLTSIAILAALHWIFSASIVNILCGMVYHTFGGRPLFRWFGVFCAAWSVFLLFYYEIKQRINKSSPYSRLPSVLEIGIDNSETGIHNASE